MEKQGVEVAERTVLLQDKSRFFRSGEKGRASYAEGGMKGKIGRLSFMLALVLVLCCPVPSSAASLKISWNPNTETDLAGYRVYYGTSSRDYRDTVEVGTLSEVVLDGFFEGSTYFLAVTAYDRSNNESPFSEEVSVEIPESPDGGILATALDAVLDLSAGDFGGDDLTRYGILDFSLVDEADLADSLLTVRIGDPAGPGPEAPEEQDAYTPADSGIRDLITEVGEPVDLSTLYAPGTYFFLPLTAGFPQTRRGTLICHEPGAHLCLVMDGRGEPVHTLRISAVDLLTLVGEYVCGEGLLIRDPELGITLALSGGTPGESFPIALGLIASDSSGSGAALIDPGRILEFAIAPLGLVLPGPAEVRAPYGSAGEAVVEAYDEGAGRWEVVENVQEQAGMAIFSTQTLGRFRVYPEPGDTAVPDSSSSGGGCFISAGAW